MTLIRHILRRISGLTTSQKMVLIVLTDRVNDDGMCFPSHQTIAEQCGIDRRTAIRCLNALSDANYIDILKVTKKGHGKRPNTYRITIKTDVTLTTDRCDSVSLPCDIDDQTDVTLTTDRCDTESHKEVRTTEEEHIKKNSEEEPPLTPPGGESDLFELNGSSPDPEKPKLTKAQTNKIFDEEFWPAYGKKVGKKAAKGQWDQAMKIGHDPQMIIQAAARQAETTPQKYRKDPERWLKGERWNDATISQKGREDDRPHRRPIAEAARKAVEDNTWDEFAAYNGVPRYDDYTEDAGVIIEGEFEEADP